MVIALHLPKHQPRPAGAADLKKMPVQQMTEPKWLRKQNKKHIPRTPYLS
jgi:hypothetical protein